MASAPAHRFFFFYTSHSSSSPLPPTIIKSPCFSSFPPLGGHARPRKAKAKALREDWRDKSKPIPPGGVYPAKDHCSCCGLCDTYYIAHVKNACAFLGDGMSRVEDLETTSPWEGQEAGRHG